MILQFPLKFKYEGGWLWAKMGENEEWIQNFMSSSGNVGIHNQGFGENATPLYAQLGLKGHDGNDWYCRDNTCLYAVHDAKVIEAGEAAGYGIKIKLEWVDAGINYQFVYGHLKKVMVKAGDIVKVGQLIGLTDNTGNSTGDHLHTGLRVLNSDGTVKNFNNGYYGYFDEFSMYHRTNVLNFDHMKKMDDGTNYTGIGGLLRWNANKIKYGVPLKLQRSDYYDYQLLK